VSVDATRCLLWPRITVYVWDADWRNRASTRDRWLVYCRIGERVWFTRSRNDWLIVLKTYIPSDAAEGQDVDAKKVLLWDRKAKGGFPGNHRNITVEVVTYF
jgi:hypothetical protein